MAHLHALSPDKANQTDILLYYPKQEAQLTETRNKHYHG